MRKSQTHLPHLPGRPGRPARRHPGAPGDVVGLGHGVGKPCILRSVGPGRSQARSEAGHEGFCWRRQNLGGPISGPPYLGGSVPWFGPVAWIPPISGPEPTHSVLRSGLDPCRGEPVRILREEETKGRGTSTVPRNDGSHEGTCPGENSQLGATCDTVPSVANGSD